MRLAVTSFILLFVAIFVNADDATPPGAPSPPSVPADGDASAQGSGKGSAKDSAKDSGKGLTKPIKTFTKGQLYVPPTIEEYKEAMKEVSSNTYTQNILTPDQSCKSSYCEPGTDTVRVTCKENKYFKTEQCLQGRKCVKVNGLTHCVLLSDILNKENDDDTVLNELGKIVKRKKISIGPCTDSIQPSCLKKDGSKVMSAEQEAKDRVAGIIASNGPLINTRDMSTPALNEKDDKQISTEIIYCSREGYSYVIPCLGGYKCIANPPGTKYKVKCVSKDHERVQRDLEASKNFGAQS